MKLITVSCVLSKEINLCTHWYFRHRSEFVLWHQKWVESAELLQVECKGEVKATRGTLATLLYNELCHWRKKWGNFCLLPVSCLWCHPECNLQLRADRTSCSARLEELLWRLFLSLCARLYERGGSQMLPYSASRGNWVTTVDRTQTSDQ